MYSDLFKIPKISPVGTLAKILEPNNYNNILARGLLKSIETGETIISNLLVEFNRYSDYLVVDSSECINVQILSLAKDITTNNNTFIYSISTESLPLEFRLELTDFKNKITKKYVENIFKKVIIHKLRFRSNLEFSINEDKNNIKSIGVPLTDKDENFLL